MNIDIETIKRKLLVKYPSFGIIIANTEIINNNNIDTACTDGEIIYYNDLFINSLSEEEQIFVFAHEISHIAYNHIVRSKDKDHDIWNYATDAVINANLQKDGLKMINGGIDIPAAINYDAETMYEKLLLYKDLIKKEMNSQLDNEQTNGRKITRVGHHDHNLWEPQEENNEINSCSNNQNNRDINNQQNNSKQSNNQQEEKENKNNSKDNSKKKQEEIKKITELGEKKGYKQNKIEKRKQLEEIRNALANKSNSSGSQSDGNYRNINDIGVASPLIDWRVLLKEAVKYDIDWSYLNATIEEGVITPHLEEFSRPETEIVLDTSGSIDETLLKNFLRECKNILQTGKVKVGCFDTKFYGFQEIKSEYDIDNMKFPGGGGTSFNAAINAFTKRVENKIIFTDGYAYMPDKKIDAIWVVFGNYKINPVGGKVIYINEKSLRKLRYTNTPIIKKKLR